MSPDPLAYIPEWRERLLRLGWWHSFELPDGTLIQGVCELDGLKKRAAQFPIPDDLAGKRVLDIGAWDGWFSFEMERRGAEVVAIDRFDNPRFREIHERLGSRVEYRVMDVYDVSPRTLGTFDIVLFLGVLYHLKHPLLGLERVCSVTRDMAMVESFALGEQHGITAEQEQMNLLRYFEDDDFGGQVDNWFAPTTAALLAMCRTAGFARVELRNRHEFGSAVACYRKWSESQVGAPVQLLAALNAENFGINLSPAKDEYVTCVVAPGAAISRDTVFPEAGGFGVRPVFVGVNDSGYTVVHFKLPPGLTPGWHEVRLRGGTATCRIAVDLETVAERIEIVGTRDGSNWEQDTIASEFLSLWVRGLPENADLHNVEVWIGEKRQVVTYVGAESEGLRQVNVRVQGVGPGGCLVWVRFGETRSGYRSLKAVGGLKPAAG
jgi:tRNA (mo5U34)-methyltransferase